jgi:small membrane protein
MIIQIVATGIILVIFGQLALRVIKDKASIVKILFWLIFWGAALVLIWLPQGTIDSIGQFFGVEKGLDLVVYMSIIILFYIVLRIYNKVDKLQKNITKLVREIAKSNAK